MSSFDIAIRRTLRLTSVELRPEQLGRIAEAAIPIQQKRIKSGLDITDAPAKPLSLGYQRSKVRRGRQGIRDLSETGNTLGAMTVTGVADGIATIGFRSAKAGRIAAVNQTISQQFGFSPNDTAELMGNQIQPAFAENVAGALRGV